MNRLWKASAARLVLALAGCSIVALAQVPSSRPVKLEVRPTERSIQVGQRTSIVVRLLDDANHPVTASKDVPVEILRRVGTGAKTPIAKAVVHSGQSQVEVALPAAEDAGLTYLWARHPELMIGGGYVQVKKVKAPDVPRSGTFETYVAPGNQRFKRLPGGGAEMPAPAPPPPHSSYQLALRYSPERSFLADGKDRATIHAFVISDGSAPPPGFRVNFFDGSGKMSPKPMVIRPGEEEGEAELTYDHVGTVKVQFVSANPPLVAEGSPEVEIHFDPAITGVELTANPHEASLMDTADLVATLVDDTGKPIPTHEARTVTFTRNSGRGDIEKQEVTIEAGKAEAHTRFSPTWWGAAEIVASTPNLMRATATVQIVPPWGLLGISLFGGLAGAGMFLLKTPAEKRWRIPVGAMAGLTLFWAALFFGLAGLSRNAVLNPFSIFIISMAGGWAGPRIFDFVLDHLMPGPKPAADHQPAT